VLRGGIGKVERGTEGGGRATHLRCRTSVAQTSIKPSGRKKGPFGRTDLPSGKRKNGKEGAIRLLGGVVSREAQENRGPQRRGGRRAI